MRPAVPASASVLFSPEARPKRSLRLRLPLRSVIVPALVAIALGATFALYLRPGLTLSLNQLMAFCGVL